MSNRTTKIFRSAVNMLTAFMITAAITLIYPLQAVYAIEASDIEPIPIREEDINGSVAVFDDWAINISYKFLNRDCIQVSVPTGVIAASGRDGDLPFHQMFGGKYCLTDFPHEIGGFRGGDNDFVYRNPGKGDGDEDSFIFIPGIWRSGVNNIPSGFVDDIGDRRIQTTTIETYLDRTVDNKPGIFTKIMADEEIVKEFADSEFDCDDNANVRFNVSFSGSDWSCQDHSESSGDTIYIYPNLDTSTLENFNISYVFDSAAARPKLKNVLDKGDEVDFYWCDNRDDGRGLFVRDDCEGEEFLVDEEHNEFIRLNTVQNLGNTPTIFTVSKDRTSDDGYHIVAAGEDSAADTTAPDDDNEGPSGGTDDDCDAGAGLSWIICGTLNILKGAIEKTAEIAENMLFFPPENISTSSRIYDIWKAVRNLANIGLVLVFIAIIYSQATGGKE